MNCFKYFKVKYFIVHLYSGHGLYGSVAKQSLQKQCKNYQKIHGQTGGAVPGRRGRTMPPSPEYATGRWCKLSNDMSDMMFSY